MGKFKGYKRRKSSDENTFVQQKSTENSTWQNTPFSVQRKPNKTSSTSMELQLKRARESGFDFSKVSLRAPQSGVTVQRMSVGSVGDKYEVAADKSGENFAEEMKQNKHNPVQKQEEDQVNMKADSVQREPEDDDVEMKADSVQRNEIEESDDMNMKSDSVQREPEDDDVEMKADSVQRNEIEESDDMNMKSDSVQRNEIEESDDMNMKPDSIQRGGDGLNLDGGELSSQLESEVNDVKKNETRDMSPQNQKILGESSTFEGSQPSVMKVATSKKAGEVCQKLGARAATTGNVMMFKNPSDHPDDLSTASPDVQKLNGHEYEHGLQQGAVPVVRSKKDNDS